MRLLQMLLHLVLGLRLRLPLGLRLGLRLGLELRLEWRRLAERRCGGHDRHGVCVSKGAEWGI